MLTSVHLHIDGLVALMSFPKLNSARPITERLTATTSRLDKRASAEATSSRQRKELAPLLPYGASRGPKFSRDLLVGVPGINQKHKRF